MHRCWAFTGAGEFMGRGGGRGSGCYRATIPLNSNLLRHDHRPAIYQLVVQSRLAGSRTDYDFTFVLRFLVSPFALGGRALCSAASASSIYS